MSSPAIQLQIESMEGKITRVELQPSSGGFSWHLLTPDPHLEKQIDRFLSAYLEKKEAPLPPYSIEQASPFLKKVLLNLAEIPFGHSLTYKELADTLSTAPRAVGGALGRNPIPFFLPCHRVVAKEGLGGFSCGLDLKKELLKFEIKNQ